MKSASGNGGLCSQGLKKFSALTEPGVVRRSHAAPEQFADHIGKQPKHIFDVLSDHFQQADWKSQDSLKGVREDEEEKRIPLNVTVLVSNIFNVDTHARTFRAVVRLFLVWEMDLAACGEWGKEWSDQAARAKKGYYPLGRDEVKEFSELVEVPSVGFTNVIDQEVDDDVGIRVYRRRATPDQIFDVIVWNVAYDVTIRQHFDLKLFPFDVNDLHLTVELNCPVTWDKYELVIDAVIVHRDVNRVNDFKIDIPRLKLEQSESLARRRKTVLIPVERQWKYYAHSFASVLIMLSMLSQLAFCCDFRDVGDRVSVVLTAFLAVVAFKFTVELPKLNYVTILDHYMILMMVGIFASGMLAVTAKKLEDFRERHYMFPGFSDLLEDVDLMKLDYWCSLLDLATNLSPHVYFAIKAFRMGARSSPVLYVPGKNYMRYDFATPFFAEDFAASGSAVTPACSDGDDTAQPLLPGNGVG